MISVPFFEIHDGVRDRNFVNHCHIHILSHPWLNRNFRVFRHKSTYVFGGKKFRMIAVGLIWLFKFS